MIKKTVAILIIFAAALSVSAMRATNSVTETVDTRDYILTVTSAFGETFPSATYTNSWRSTVYRAVIGTPIFEQSNTVLRTCSGFSGEGISPASGTGDSTWVMLTNENSTLTWIWDTAYWVTRVVSGQGDIFGGSGSAGWYNEGQSYLLKARPDYGWLFTGWSGGASGGSAATNLNFTAIAPTNLLASFSDDPDDDGLKNTDEWTFGSSPWLANTDGDAYDDAFEYAHGLSPIRDSSAFINYVQDNADSFGLYPSNVVLDVAVGQILLETAGGSARISLQLEESDDLVSWTNSGNVVEWTRPVGAEKKYFRVQAGD